MTRERWIILGVAAVAVAAAVWYFTGGTTERAAIDLIQQFDSAEKRPADPPSAEWCTLTEATLNGVTRRAVKVLPVSRLIYRLTVPSDSTLQVWIGLEPDVWDKEGDGVLFRFGVSDGRGLYDELLNQLVNPRTSTVDRQWIPVSIDLSAYGGRQVELIFNTNAGLGRSDDTRNDKPLWAEPAIVPRQ